MSEHCEAIPIPTPIPTPSGGAEKTGSPNVYGPPPPTLAKTSRGAQRVSAGDALIASE